MQPIGKIQNLEITFGNEEKMHMNFLVFQNFNQIIVKERSIILYSSKESIPPVPDRKCKEKEKEDSEAIETIKEESKKMRRNLDIAIENPEKLLALNVSGMNKYNEGEITQKEFKVDLKQPEANCEPASM
ncbi:hypothetical protein O181_115932 [Austropuccinia psidii MF-1]|uniref:Uncharacterized protein n=1 Tax=Austropuccinia psidii MF-1 TaxID=1389203 RepID=A0A9Q3PXV6_9BASI|nr:hypothetical protein [Austropuccinia psidii MF-1]